jgi:diguanylate cyclase (GGDEF)-like protein
MDLPGQHGEPSPAGPGGAVTPQVEARIGALLFLMGVLTCPLAAAGLTLSPEADRGAYWILAGAEALTAAVILAVKRRPALVRTIVVVAGTAGIAASLYFDGERQGGPPVMIEMYYTWGALYIGFFGSGRRIAAAVGLVAASYLAVLEGEHLGTQILLTRLLVVVIVYTLAAIVLHLLRLRIDGLVARLRESARTDPLTLLPNRRHFQERFEHELARARRSQEPLALLMGDVDHFKLVNDRLGHPAGDAVLLQVATTLRSACRASDLAARVGGEEFALLLPAAEQHEAFAIAERIRKAIAERAAGERTLSMSFGLAQYPRDGETAEALMRAADCALYAAKASGRDRTVIHDSEPPDGAELLPAHGARAVIGQDDEVHQFSV